MMPVMRGGVHRHHHPAPDRSASGIAARIPFFIVAGYDPVLWIETSASRAAAR